MTTQIRTNWAIAAIVALAAIGIVAPLAFADDIGAPTSAAGGLSTPTSPRLPPPVGPLGSSSSGAVGGSTSPSIHDQTLGTGKFEGPKNGTNVPCIGSTGFGSSSTLPGHKC
jgi:hypothetical protein